MNFSIKRTLILMSSLFLLLAPGALASSSDRDRDGMPDTWERANGLNPAKNDSTADKDKDGLSNWGEYRAHTNPSLKDSDRDRIGDASEDYDRDRLTNGGEIQAATDPGTADTNHDGIKDGDEDSDHDGLSNQAEEREGTNPGKRDSDGDGIGDHSEIKGTVTASDAGSITVSRRDGSITTVTVDADTRFHGPDHNSNGKADVGDIQTGDRVEIGVSGSLALKVEYSNSTHDSKGEAKGTVSAVGSNSVTITRRDGGSVTLMVDSNTKIKAPDRDSSGTPTLADVQVGDKIEAYTSADGSLALSLKVEAGEDHGGGHGGEGSDD